MTTQELPDREPTLHRVTEPGPGLIAQLIARRRGLRVPQLALAERLHVSRSTMSSRENGSRRTSIEELERWADALGLQVRLEPK